MKKMESDSLRKRNKTKTKDELRKMNSEELFSYIRKNIQNALQGKSEKRRTKV